MGLKQKFENLPGSWLILIGAFLWSTSAAVVKSFDTDPLLVAGLRSLVGGAVLAFAIRPKKIVFDKWLLLACLFYLGMVTCVMQALRLTTAAMAIAMQYTAPIWLFLLSWLVTRKLDKARLPVMGVILLALILFLLEPATGRQALGNALAFIMGPLFAGLSYCMKKIRHDNAVGVVAILNLFVAVVLLPVCWLLPSIQYNVSLGDWACIAYLAIFQLSCGYVFYLQGVKKVTPQRATILAIWEFILTPVWVFLVVGEIPGWFTVCACLLLITALLWDNYLDGKEARLLRAAGS